jgi:hypothetical protein
MPATPFVAHSHATQGRDGGLLRNLKAKGRARMLQFLVVNHGTDWVVKRKTQSAGRYTDRLKAITAAIDLANAEGK